MSDNTDREGLSDKAANLVGRIAAAGGLLLAAYSAKDMLHSLLNQEKDEAKATVRSMCMSLDPGVSSGTIGMMPMTLNVTAFGQEKVDEWCGCAYREVSKTFTDKQINSSENAGMYDPITQQLSDSVTISTALCIKKSNIPSEGRRHANAYADMLIQGYKVRKQLGNALSKSVN
jgi:hypothetical protein